MDKLERALERARQQRQNALAGGVGVDQSRPAPSSRVDAGSPAEIGGSSRGVTLHERVLDQHRIVSGKRGDPNAEVFRVLRTKVLQMAKRHKLRAIAVTSPRYGDGKSTIAVNLALSLAMDVNQTIALVDLDLRKPSLHQFLGIETQTGLNDYLLHDAPMSDCFVRPSTERVVVLPLSKPVENSSETLGTPKMAALAHEMKSRYPDRIVIYDMPPLLGQSDTLAFLHNVDGVLLVVREGVTQVQDVKDAMHLLADSAVIGTVLNRSAERGYNRV